jgi:hypothetical protein
MTMPRPGSQRPCLPSWQQTGRRSLRAYPSESRQTRLLPGHQPRLHIYAVTLLSRLRECAQDERELSAVLSGASGGGTRRLSQGRAEYVVAGAKEVVYATVSFRRGRVTQIVPGPALSDQAAQDALVERARYETSHDHGTVEVSRILLAERKLTGSYGWRDRFRVVPCPASAPIGTGLNWFGQAQLGEFGESPEGPPYPFVLQVNIARSPNPFVQANRTLRELDTYQNLLTLLVSGHVRTFDRPGERTWVSLKRESGLEYHLLHPGFSFSDASQQSDAPAPVYRGDDYYNHLWGADSEILLPPSLDSDLALFESLGNGEAHSFKRATYWFALGMRSRGEPALSTVCFSTAIECLLPRSKRTRCSACGQETGAGPTHLFKAHLSRYGTLPPSLHKQRAAIYGVRSDLVHGSFAAAVDTDKFSVFDDAPSHDLLVELVARRSLLNWLRDPHRMTWHGAPTLVENECEHPAPT